MYSPLVSFPFAVLFVSVLSNKLVHLYMHFKSVPPGLFVLYLPTFFVPDALILCAGRLLIRRERGVLPLLGFVFGCLLSIVTLGAAASQLGFYYETGGELEWEDASTFTNEPEGMKVLLSGLTSVLVAGTVVLVVSWVSKTVLYKAVGIFLVAVGNKLASVFRLVATAVGLKKRRSPQPDLESMSDEGKDSFNKEEGDEDDVSEARGLLREKNKALTGKCSQYFSRIPLRLPSWLVTAAVLIFLGVTSIVRPDKPYTHMSTTLPIPLLDIFKAKADYCDEQARLKKNKWPLPDLIDKSVWDLPKGYFKGWAPGSSNEYVKQYQQWTPEWMPTPMPDGFFRWDPERFRKSFLAKVSVGGEGSNPITPEEKKPEDKCPSRVEDDFYNPVDDPLRITNLDVDVLDAIKPHLKDVKIRHVAFILMESLREELFPIQQGSDIHRFIMESHNEDDREAINEQVSRMTPNTEKLTGKDGRFKSRDGKDYDRPTPEWNDTTRPGFGGINVVGGLTTSTASTKSAAVGHCGVWPLAVDMFEESETQSYQPCIPQILDLFNSLKENQSTDNYLEQQWHSVFFQAVTDGYDRQDRFNEKMGFRDVVAKGRLEKDAEDDPYLKEINYFGFPETALKPYMTNFIKNATANNQRMFFSHFTSTTHHPWQTPKHFNDTKYMRTQGLLNWHEDFNKYLNTIHFHDQWLGELMQLFDDLGISNETLVIFVGDHGQAFKEDHSKTGTYENGHISNFRVPITFRHPNLPRVQYHANATSISVLPTILDLLISTGSLNEKDTSVALDLVQEYEGQSLIRPYKTTHNGRRAWNFGVVNSGGGLLTVTSADAPWRFSMPLDLEVEYSITDLMHDPLELKPISAWSMKGLIPLVVAKFGEDAGKWASEAEEVATWWALERKRLWKYDPRNKDRNKEKEDSA